MSWKETQGPEVPQGRLFGEQEAETLWPLELSCWQPPPSSPHCVLTSQCGHPTTRASASHLSPLLLFSSLEAKLVASEGKGRY